MDTHCNAPFSRAGHVASPPDATTDFCYSITPQLAVGDLDVSYNYNCNNSCSSGSGCSSYIGSPSYDAQRLMQRSVSSHSLHYNNNNNNNNIGGVQHPFSPLFAELLHSPVRRVYSTGDLQRINGTQHYHQLQSDSPLSSESSMIIEGMTRANPYSPEEKKLRIERYRSKRNLRNFNKKITYACRKTLADSRPRIRGRFARNDEIVMNPPVQWSHLGVGAGEGEEEEEEDENWVNFFDSLVPENLAQEPQGSSSFGVFY